MTMNLPRSRDDKERAEAVRHQSLFIEHDIEEENVTEQLLSTVDKIEDEFDKNAYEELIPLNIRLELENRIFGWDHLSSALLGHVLFPLSSFVATFWMISLIGLRYIPSSSSSGSSIDTPSKSLDYGECHDIFQCACGWQCIYQKLRFDGKTSKANLHPLFGMSVSLFLFLRQFLSLWAAFNTFRMIRRRRQVWLTHTATEYFKDAKQHEKMRIVDRTTLLGKMRRKLKARRMQKKMKKAEKRFEKRDKIRMHKVKRIRFSKEESYKDSSDESGSSSSDDERKGLRNYHQDESEAKPNPKEFVEIYNKFKDTRQTSFESSSKNVFESTFYARTMPIHAMQSINMDQIRLKSQINNISYAHGGFFGAAPFMLANPHWIDILRYLMPDVYVEISPRVVHAPAPQLIHWAENNPVVAAFGTAHELEFSGRITNIEWDVFLDPHLAQRLDVALQARDNFITKLKATSSEVKSLFNSDSGKSNNKNKIEEINTILASDETMTDERKIFKFYNNEIEKRANILLDKMFIAHGNTSQLILEQTGLMKNINFSRVKRTRRTLGGGVFAKYWIATFAQALKLSTLSNTSSRSIMSSSQYSHFTGSTKESSVFEQVDHERDSLLPSYSSDVEIDEYVMLPEGRSIQDISQSEETSFRNLSHSTGAGLFPSMLASQPSTIDEAISALKEITGHDTPLGLVLDLKSRHVPKRVWAQLIDTMRKVGLRVEAVGTFYIDDIRDVSSLCTVPVNEVIFLHTAGDLQHACHSGLIRENDSVYFNAGSLFWNRPIRNCSDFTSMLHTAILDFDVDAVKKQYLLEPYARVVDDNNSEKTTSKKTGDDVNVFNVKQMESSTIQQYKNHYKLSIGLYLQEFCVDDGILNILIEYVNNNGHIYDLGFSWGGVNGLTVNGIQPGRFTNTDGLWNQRYVGNIWETTKYPNES